RRIDCPVWFTSASFLLLSVAATNESPGLRALQCLLKGHARTFQARILGGHQPYRNVVKVAAHVALVAQTTAETTMHEEFRAARHYAANNIRGATRAGGQYVASGYPTQPGAEMFQYGRSIGLAGQRRRGHLGRRGQLRLPPVQLATGAIEFQQPTATE